MIFFLHGADSWRARQKLKEIEAKYRASYPEESQMRFIDCAEVSGEEVRRLLIGNSLFEKKRMMVFQNVFGKSVLEELFCARAKRLAQDQGRIAVIFESQAITGKATSKLYRLLVSHAAHQEFAPLSARQLSAWIKQEFHRYNLAVSSRAQEILSRETGNDLWRLAQEIRKIAAWKQSLKERQVKEADVALLVGVRREADIFSTIDAVAQKNKKQALALLYRHLHKGDSPLYLLSMLCYQMRILLQIRDAHNRGVARTELAQKTKLHPYVLQKGMQVAQKFSFEEMKALYGVLFALDANLKTGRMEPAGAFDLFIAKL